jgi:hypothetical protein
MVLDHMGRNDEVVGEVGDAGQRLRIDLGRLRAVRAVEVGLEAFRIADVAIVAGRLLGDWIRARADPQFEAAAAQEHLA